MNKSQVAQLVKRAQKGDAEAFAHIYNLYINSVYYLALKLTKNEHDAKDATQDTMINLYKNINRVSTQKSLSAYINKIAYNASVTLLRKRKDTIQEEDDQSDTLERIVEENEEFIPQNFVENMETRALLLKLVDGLNDTLKPVIIMFYYNELSIKQIAQALDIQETAVKKRLVRGRETLKKQLEDKLEPNDRGKEGIFALSVPVLTKIMREEAENLCYDQIKCEIWENFCQINHLTNAVTTATTPIALGQAATDIISKTHFIPFKALMLAGGVVTSVTVMLINSVPFIEPVLPITRPQVVEASLYESKNSSDISEVEIKLDGHYGQMSDGYTAPSPEAASSGAEQQYNDDIDVPFASTPSLPADDGESPESFPAVFDPPDEENGETKESETTDEDDTESSSEDSGQTESDPPEDLGGTTDITQVSPQFWLEAKVLFYPLGAELITEQILQDSGSYAIDKNGEEIELAISRMDSVNTNRPGIYPVYIQTVGHDPLLGMEIFIIIK